MLADVPLRPSVQPCTAVGSPIISLGVSQATIDWIVSNKVSRSIDTNIHVLRELKKPVLSKNSQQAIHMLPPDYPATCINLVTEAVTVDRQKADLERLIGEFPNIFDGQCRSMSGSPCHFQLIDGVLPAAMRGSRPVSVPLLPRLKTLLQNLEEAGIICKVIKLTAWVHPIVVVPKKNGDIRLAIDFRKLNECIIRPNFETATPFQAVSEVFDDVPNTRRIVEDILVYSSTYEDHVKAVRALFKQAAIHGVAINTSKMVFAQPAVTFGGYVVDSDGFRPDPKLTRAIRDFPTPHSIADIRSFFELCQQVGNFSDKLSKPLDSLSPLLKKGFAWEWTSTHEDAFKTARTILSEVRDLAFKTQSAPLASTSTHRAYTALDSY